MAYLLDTNVISELRMAHPNDNVRAWIDRESTAELYISALVVGEIRQGIERLRGREAARADSLARRPRHDLCRPRAPSDGRGRRGMGPPERRLRAAASG
jgi:predicted nucleic acid-binding protein